ncbi:MAG: hypothetical protein LAQ69_27015 [Acidobacteriia bacterium]|nr:hypothetical protein [Terriglobia bacterium]
MFYKLLLAGICATTLVLAQGRGGGGGGGMGGGGGDSGGEGGGMRGGASEGAGIQMPRVVTRMDTISEMLQLNKQQKKEVKSILDEGQKEAAPVRDQIAKSRLAIGEAIQGGKSDDDLKPLVNSQAALTAQMAGIELSAFVKIYKLLDKEQLQQTRGVFPMMKGIFEGKNWNSAE